MSYGPGYSLEGRDGARYVDKILKGSKPTNLPVEQPTKFELIVNQKTANAPRRDRAAGNLDADRRCRRVILFGQLMVETWPSMELRIGTGACVK